MFKEIEYIPDREAAEIAQLIAKKNSIIITSNYKGIILTQPVRVLGIVPGRVIIQAPDLTICFTLKERIHLHSLAFREIISARLLTVNRVLGKLELADLTMAGWHWNERQSDRVQPRSPIYVYGEHKKELIRASLDNLSVEGMSLMIYKNKAKMVPIDPDSAMRLTLQLPGEEARLDLKGRVVRERQIGRLDIIGLQLMASKAQEKRIHRYVLARKAEILAELEQTVGEILEQQHWNPDVYF
jgi:hypothetical protein